MERKFNMKKIVLLGLLLSVSIGLTGCSFENNSNFIPVNNKGFTNITEILSYDSNTKIIYYLINDGKGYSSVGYMSPYYSENGKLCKYNVKEQKIEKIKINKTLISCLNWR